MSTNTDNREGRIPRLKRTIQNYMASTDKMTQFWDACKIAEWALLETEREQEANKALSESNKELREALRSILNQDRVNNNYADTCSAMKTTANKALNTNQ